MVSKHIACYHKALCYMMLIPLLAPRGNTSVRAQTHILTSFIKGKSKRCLLGFYSQCAEKLIATCWKHQEPLSSIPSGENKRMFSHLHWCLFGFMWITIIYDIYSFCVCTYWICKNNIIAFLVGLASYKASNNHFTFQAIWDQCFDVAPLLWSINH